MQLFQILTSSGIRFCKARSGLLPLLVQILAADFWNRILLDSPFGLDSAARQRNPSIKVEPNRAFIVSVSNTKRDLAAAWFRFFLSNNKNLPGTPSDSHV